MPELTWEGKYDPQGRKVAPLKVALPFQTVETVNESAADRLKTIDAFTSGRQTEWRNRLIWGDKKYVLPSLLPEFAGKVNLIYIDPPFATGADFSFTARIPDNPETEEDESAEFTKQPSMIEMKAYRDTWGKGLNSYLKWFYETAVFLLELLSEDGSIYVHCDWHAGHYIKAVMDQDVFGYNNFRNEIIWFYENKLGTGWESSTFDTRHDALLIFGKGNNSIHNTITEPVKVEKLQPVTQKIEGKRIWLKDENGRRMYAPSASERPIGDVWTIPIINPVANERLGYATQKPEALLERIIKASSNEGDLVFDCFCGSGTTAAVAEKLNRRWIAADLGRFAIHTTRKRLLQIPDLKPFVVQNLGKYERQYWQSAEFGEENAKRQLAYRKFILDLYGAREINGYLWLHGVKAGRMVHVGAVDSPVTESDLANMAAEFKKAMGTGEQAPTTNGIDVLGWDFAFEVNEVAKARAELAGLDVRLKKIPMDVMDKRAVDQGDVKFFELAALEVVASAGGRTAPRQLGIQITNFIIPQDDLPEEVRGKITHWSQWIDYWAVDWDYQNDTFHNQWQSYRTRKDNTLALKTSNKYEQPGKYYVVIKVVDILGNDTTKMISVEVK